MRLVLLVKEIADFYVRENFQKILRFLEVENQFRGFRHITIVRAQGGTNVKYPHNLGYLPQDVVTTFITPGVTLTWNYDKFDMSFLDFTISGPGTVRAYVGTHEVN